MVFNAICNGVIIFSGGSMVFFFFVVFFTNVIVLPRDVVPYANSILCILVSFISHKPDRKGTLVSDFKGAGARAAFSYMTSLLVGGAPSRSLQGGSQMCGTPLIFTE